MTEDWTSDEDWSEEVSATDEDVDMEEVDATLAVDEEFVIESDKPLPKPSSRKYPFEKMRLGDSFEVKVDPAVIEERGLTDAVRLQRSALSSSASNFNKRHDDRRMVVRKTGPTTLRCWCVAPE